MGLVVGSLLVTSTAGLPRLVATVAAGLAGAVVLHLPWAFDFLLPGATWEMVVGTGSAADPSVAELLRFDVGPVGSSALVLGLPLAALLPLSSAAGGASTGRSDRGAWP